MTLNEPSPEVATWLAALGPTDKKTVQKLRGLINGTMPEAHEIIHHGMLGYSLNESSANRLVYIGVFSFHVNVGFFFGKSLKDPTGLLTGTGKRMRHVNVISARDINEPALSALLKQAWDNGPKELEQAKREKINVSFRSDLGPQRPRQ